jgi:hypothetical protein
VALSITAEQTIRRMANFFKWKFQLRGLFGLDFIVSADDQVWLTEINPRYTGSVELLEFVTGQSLLIDHCACFEYAPPPAHAPAWIPATDKLLGKAVLYSPGKLTVNLAAALSAEGYRDWPRVADVPPAGTLVERGEPICTVFSAGETAVACRTRLFAAARQVYEALQGGP